MAAEPKPNAGLPIGAERRTAPMIERLRARNEWKFFGILPQADRTLAVAWWARAAAARDCCPRCSPSPWACWWARCSGVTTWLYPWCWWRRCSCRCRCCRRFIRPSAPISAAGRPRGSTTSSPSPACGRRGWAISKTRSSPATSTMARDFDLGITGPPMSISMDFIAFGLVEMVAGLASAVVLAGYAWWAPLLLAGAWLATHWLLRESGVWRDRNTEEVREAQRHADYAYRLAVEPPAAKELRLFGLADWVVERFRCAAPAAVRAAMARPRACASGRWCGACAGACRQHRGVLVDGERRGRRRTLALDRVVTFASAAIGTSMIAFGGLSWALDGAAAPVAAVLRLEEAMDPAGALVRGTRAASGMPAREIRFRDVTFAYPATGEPVLEGFDLTIPAGSSLAIVGQNGAGKTTLAKLLCRLYDPQAGAIEIDGVDLRELDLDGWRSRVAAVFQDFIRFELPLRDNVAPAGAPDDVIRAALADAGAADLADLDTVLARGYEGGTDLSGGQWQRVALARALCAVRLGAGVVLLDEPTAQLDVRGEAEIFDRILDRHAPHDDDPHLAPVLDGASRRPHLRARGRPGGRAGHARGADGRRRPLSHHV